MFKSRAIFKAAHNIIVLLTAGPIILPVIFARFMTLKLFRLDIISTF